MKSEENTVPLDVSMVEELRQLKKLNMKKKPKSKKK